MLWWDMLRFLWISKLYGIWRNADVNERKIRLGIVGNVRTTQNVKIVQSTANQKEQTKAPANQNEDMLSG